MVIILVWLFTDFTQTRRPFQTQKATYLSYDGVPDFLIHKSL